MNREIISRLRARHEPAIWDLIYNHPDGIVVEVEGALRMLNNIITNSPNITLEQQYLLFLKDFIRRGNRTDVGDKLQTYTTAQLQKLINDCFGDFTLLLFCAFLLSIPQVRETYLKGTSMHLQLYLDLIYCKTINYDRINSNNFLGLPIALEQRYLVAESLAFEFTR